MASATATSAQCNNKENVARQIEALKRYAAFDRSDAFTFNRGMCHIARGLTNPCVKSEMRWAWRDKGKSTGAECGPAAGTPGHYDATKTMAGWVNVSRL